MIQGKAVRTVGIPRFYRSWRTCHRACLGEQRAGRRVRERPYGRVRLFYSGVGKGPPLRDASARDPAVSLMYDDLPLG